VVGVGVEIEFPAEHTCLSTPVEWVSDMLSCGNISFCLQDDRQDNSRFWANYPRGFAQPPRWGDLEQWSVTSYITYGSMYA